MILDIQMHDPAGRIMQEIADPAITQASVVITYAFLIAQDEGRTADWPTINAAIRDRWSGKSALGRIKKGAWRLVDDWRERKVVSQ